MIMKSSQVQTVYTSYNISMALHGYVLEA